MEYFKWNADPVLLQLGFLQVYWYGFLFIGSFGVGLLILKQIFVQENRNPEILESLFVYIVVGAALGARLAHCFFYDPSYYLANPMKIFAIWEGGLASHGGVIGVLLATWMFTRKYNESFMWLLARLAIPAALSGAAIRLGNFINSEIVGQPTDVPWAIIFQRLDNIPRHPSQLYEALAYLIIFVLLWTTYKSVKNSFATKLLPALWFISIFTVRFFLEFVKTKQAAYSTDLAFTTGQLLSIPFIVLGLIWLLWAFISKTATPH
jgi:prolipoprotein diacylglyceryl transferase